MLSSPPEAVRGEEVVNDNLPQGREKIGELVAFYSPSLERDPALVDLVIAVANRHFSPKQGGGGLMSMISGMLGGGSSVGGAQASSSSTASNAPILDAD